MNNIYFADNIFEALPGTDQRHESLGTGENISHREYNNRVLNGSLENYPDGAQFKYLRIEYFQGVNTIHQIYYAWAADVSSVKKMGTSVLSTLPSNASVAYRLKGEFHATDGGDTLVQPAYLSTKQWLTHSDAVVELLRIADDFRNTNMYGVNIDFYLEYCEVVFRFA